MDEQELKNKAVLGVFWVGSTKVLSQAISWVSTLLVIRILTPDDYGLMGMALVFVGFIHIFNEMGLGAAIIQKQEIDRKDLSTIFWVNLIISCGLYSLLFLLAPIIAVFFDNEQLIILIRVLGLNLILGSLRTVQFHMLIKEMAFDKKSKAEVISNLLSGLTGLIFAYRGFGVWSLVISALVRNVTLTVLVTYYYTWKPLWMFQPGRIKGFLRFGSQVMGSGLLAYGYGRTDSLVIGKMLGQRLLGFYSIALELSGKGIDLLSEILSQVSFPVYARLQRDRESLRRYFLKLTRLVSLVVFPSYGGLILIADDFFTIILTDQWLPAVTVFQILCGMAMIRGLGFLIPQLLIAAGRADLSLRYGFLCAMIMPAAFAVGSKFGLAGVASAWLIVFPFLFYYALTLVFKITHLSLPVYARTLLPAISGSVIMASAVILFQSLLPPGMVLVRFAGSCAIGAITYLMFIHLVFHALQDFSFILPVLRRFRA